MKAAMLGSLAVLALLVGGCATVSGPVPVAGAPADLGQLAGEWSGVYHGETSGRSGNIVFKLTAGADNAFGDVVMIPRGWREQLPLQDPSAGLPISRAPEVLSIAFVRAAGGGVSGQLKPYRDPDCDCTTITRFEGRIRGHVIVDTFTSTHVERGDTQTGTWKVTRKKS